MKEGLFKTCVDLLAHLPNTVREVRFSVPVPSGGRRKTRGDHLASFVYYDWAALEKALCDPRFKGTTLVLEMRTIPPADDDPGVLELKELITRMLGGLHARGMLTLTIVQVARWDHL